MRKFTAVLLRTFTIMRKTLSTITMSHQVVVVVCSFCLSRYKALSLLQCSVFFIVILICLRGKEGKG